MTLEELKEEAKRQGYGLHKIQAYIGIVKCPACGKRPKAKVSIGNQTRYECECGKSTGWYKSDKKARAAWNELIKGEDDANY